MSQYELDIAEPPPPRRRLRLAMLPARLRHKIKERTSKLPTPCWHWVGKTDTSRGKGYPRMPCGSARDRSRQPHMEWNVHRLTLKLAGRPVSHGEEVHHRCFNTLCVNPDHLLVVKSSEHRAIHQQERAERGAIA
jgi:hypothetical protein